MRHRERTYEEVKYIFTPEEALTLGQQLAKQLCEIEELEAHRDAVVTEMRSTIKNLTGEAAQLAHKVRDGYEVREVEVITLLDSPVPGTKQVLRLDTNAVIRQVPMTPEERQASLFDGDDPR